MHTQKLLPNLANLWTGKQFLEGPKAAVILHCNRGSAGQMPKRPKIKEE